MRLITFDAGQGGRPGVGLDAATMLDLDAALARTPAIGQAPFGSLHELIGRGPAALEAVERLVGMAASGALDAAKIPVAQARVLAPIPRPAKNVFCVGRNYVEHIAEGARAQRIALDLPEFPVFFSKPPTAVIGPGDPIPVHVEVSTKVDYEVELAVVIGKRGRNIKAGEAFDHVFGYTIVNDVTARDLQKTDGQWTRAKGFDGFCPVGEPGTPPEDLGQLRVVTTVNGSERQRGSASDMAFDIPQILAYVSGIMTLEPGDLVLTGTPAGVGTLAPEDVVEVQVLGPGDAIVSRVRNPVTARR